MRLHKHMEDLLVVITDGAGFDCPSDRACWFEGPPHDLGRQVRREGVGAVFVFDDSVVCDCAMCRTAPRWKVT